MENKNYEFSAATEEEAIAAGLEELGLSRQEVEVEVLDSGSKGIFGLGARLARVLIHPISSLADVAPVMEKSHLPHKHLAEATVEADQELEEEYSESEDEETEETSRLFGGEVVNEDSLATTITVVEDLLEKMRVRATVEGKIDVQPPANDQPLILIDIKGEDLSYLIGRHSETLNALQYITSLIVGREIGHWVPLQIDVQGFRKRRERQLHRMALSMADQVMKTGRRIPLEPMTCPERRIFFFIDTDRDDVYTESIGEEPNRKVVIYPREE